MSRECQTTSLTERIEWMMNVRHGIQGATSCLFWHLTPTWNSSLSNDWLLQIHVGSFKINKSCWNDNHPIAGNFEKNAEFWNHQLTLAKVAIDFYIERYRTEFYVISIKKRSDFRFCQNREKKFPVKFQLKFFFKICSLRGFSGASEKEKVGFDSLGQTVSVCDRVKCRKY
jgi:hypothetical protein